MFDLDKNKFNFPPIGMDMDWLYKKIKLSKEVDYSIYAEPMTIDEARFKNRIQDDPIITLRTRVEKEYMMNKNRIGDDNVRRD